MKHPKKRCEQCGTTENMLVSHLTRFCRTCAHHRMTGNGAAIAHKAVRAAVMRGDIPPASAMSCIDCGGAARDYDHRDYARPLDVEPVCRSCNKRRGPARPVLDLEL